MPEEETTDDKISKTELKLDLKLKKQIESELTSAPRPELTPKPKPKETETEEESTQAGNVPQYPESSSGTMDMYSQFKKIFQGVGEWVKIVGKVAGIIVEKVRVKKPVGPITVESKSKPKAEENLGISIDSTTNSLSQKVLNRANQNGGVLGQFDSLFDDIGNTPAKINPSNTPKKLESFSGQLKKLPSLQSLASEVLSPFKKGKKTKPPKRKP